MLGAAGNCSVTYKCSAVEADIFFAVVDFSKKHCHPDAWTTTTHWPRKLDVEPADMFPPRFWERAYRSCRKGPQRQPREGASRKCEVLYLLSPFLCQGQTLRVEGRPASRRFRAPGRSAESEVGWVRVSDCEQRSATSRVSFRWSVHTEEDDEQGSRETFCDLSKARIAPYKNTWKPIQDTVNRCNLLLAQEGGLQFFTKQGPMRSSSMAHCLPSISRKPYA